MCRYECGERGGGVRVGVRGLGIDGIRDIVSWSEKVWGKWV